MRRTFDQSIQLLKQNSRGSNGTHESTRQVVVDAQTKKIIWFNLKALSFFKRHMTNDIEYLYQLDIIGTLFTEAIDRNDALLIFKYNEKEYVATFFYSRLDEHEDYVLVSIKEKVAEDLLSYLSDEYRVSEEMIILLDNAYNPVYISDKYKAEFDPKTWDEYYTFDKNKLEKHSLKDKKKDVSDKLRMLKNSLKGNLVILQRTCFTLKAEDKQIGYLAYFDYETDDLFKYQDGSAFVDIINNIADGILIATREQVTLWVNKAITKMSGYTANELIGTKVGYIKSNIHDDRFYQKMWKKLNQGISWEGTIWNKRKNGENFPVWLQIIPVVKENNEISHYVGIYKDLSGFSNSNQKLLLAIEKDPLTNIHNRTYFLEKVDSIVTQETTKGTLLFIDMDNFKEINDTYGHLIGDRVLLEVAQILTTVYSEDIIARYGGDEFVVYIKEVCDHEEIIKTIHRLSSIVINPIEIDGLYYQIDLSVGYATHTYGQKGLIELLKEADASMYTIKKNKKMGESK